MTRSFRVPRLPVFAVVVLGLAMLVAGQADAVSIEEASLFNLASHDKNHGLVQQLLAKGVSPNVPVGRFNDEQTAVHAAAEGGAVQNLGALLDAGGDLRARDRDGNTPLHLASRGGFSGYADVVRVLLERGADLHRPNARGETPLHVAVYTGSGGGSADRAVIKALLDAGAKPKTVDGTGLTAIQRFARHGGDMGWLVTLLLGAGADPDHKDPRGDAPLHAAIKEGGSNGNAAVVKALLQGGADPCVQDARGYTPYQMSSGMQRIQRALSRAGGHDLACDESRMVYGDEGTGREDTSKRTGKRRPEEATATLKPFGPNWFIAENQPCQLWQQNPEPGETITWSGACVDGKASGEGREVLYSPDGGQSVYEGEWRNGKKHGQGTYTWADGARYEGEWAYGRAHGYGTYTTVSGKRYTGEWRNGCYKAGSRWATVAATREECGF